MARLFIACLLGVAMSMAYDRLYIKRPLSQKIKVEEHHQHPKQFDNGRNHGCVPDAALVEACVVKYQKDTREAYQCYGKSVRDQAPKPDPCFGGDVTKLADICYERHEFDAQQAFECFFELLGLDMEELGYKGAKTKDRY